MNLFLVPALTLLFPLASTPSDLAQVNQGPYRGNDRDRAEEICIEAVESRGLRVVDVLQTRSYSGGEEVILRVDQRGGDLSIGCDYATATREVQLYRIQDRDERDNRDDWDDRDEDRDQYGNEVRSSDQAERIARAAARDRLGIDDSDSEVIQIVDVDRTDRNRTWIVEGRANGAPFIVRIRASDASVEDFQLY